MTVTVSYARASDAAALEALFRKIVAPLEIYNEAARADELAKYSAAQFARLIGDDASGVVIAHVDGRPGGFAITADEDGPIWLEWYGVAAEARGQGVGEKLIVFVLAEARRSRATRVWCDTRTNNVASITLLEKLGFRKLCVLPNHWHGQDYFLWELSPL